MFPEVVTGNNTVDWLKLQPLYEANKDEIESDSATTLEEVKKQNAIKDGILKDLAIAKAKNELIEKAVVKALFHKIGSAQNSLFNKYRSELPPRIANKQETDCALLIDAAFREIIQVMQGKELAEWK